VRRLLPIVVSSLLAACGGSSQDPSTAQSTQLLASATSTTGSATASDYNKVVQQIYVAYFGRPADVGGLAWHAGVLQAAGAPTDIVALANAYNTNAALRAEIDSFGTSAESASLYSGDNGQFIDALYRNLFGRPADAGGKAFWGNALDKGLMTRASAAIQLAAGAGSSDATIIANKTSAASTFTSLIATPAQQQGYNGLDANAVVRTMLGTVGAGTDMTAFTSTIKTTISTLAANVKSSVPAINSVATRNVKVFPTQVVASSQTGIATPTVPSSLTAAPAGTNLKLWLYDPRVASGAALATGIFIHNVDTNSAWNFVAAKPDGSLYQQLAPGSYQFDTVEPNGMSSTFSRHRYQVSVSANGTSIDGLSPSAQGYYAVTVDLAIQPASPQAQKLQDDLKALAALPVSDFKPTSQCQLLDQVTPNRSFSTDISAGFPKVRVRLPSYGHLRALIVAVDFPDLAGKDGPVAYYTPLANSVRDFYTKQSYGRLAFDFDIVPNWVHLPFSPSKFGISSANGSGDFAAYRAAIIGLTDKQIDYSQYDAVYFLVPKEMPFTQMGYGPAITTPTWTSTGYVVNGATGGADMYYNESHNVTGAQWKWMAHETGHAFGLYDEDLNHASQTLGFWSIMAMNWSNHAIEHNGWDRYLQGWLPEEQVACLPKSGLSSKGNSVTLSPLVRQTADIKAAMVPLSASKILVMESRRNEGYDVIANGHEGVLVYTVDMTLGTLAGGYRTQRRVGSTDPNFEDAALHAGDSITVEGVTVTVTASSTDGDTIKVSTP
jgi:M6 family metalloprotease-like protein